MVLGLPYVNLEEDRDMALELIYAEFAGLQNCDIETYDFLLSFVRDYVEGFWLNGPHDPESWNY